MSIYQKTNEYNKENYYTVTVRIPKNKKELLQELSKKERRSINQLFTIAMEEYYKINLTDTDSE